MEGRFSLHLFRTLQLIMRFFSMTRSCWLSALFSVAVLSQAGDLSSPEGLWQPLDSSGKPQGLIRIYQDQGMYFGRIQPSSPSDDDRARCVRCTDERKDQPIIGMLLIRNMRQQGDGYEGGDIVDPDTGRLYGCKFRLIDGGHNMIMRGFYGLSVLGRSQTWRRVEASQ
jgi:uncharacterized protein (DUF2147 family)